MQGALGSGEGVKGWIISASIGDRCMMRISRKSEEGEERLLASENMTKVEYCFFFSNTGEVRSLLFFVKLPTTPVKFY